MCGHAAADRQKHTDTRTQIRVTTIHFASSMTHAKFNYSEIIVADTIMLSESFTGDVCTYYIGRRKKSKRPILSDIYPFGTARTESEDDHCKSLANLNSRSRSLYAIARPSVCLYVVCLSVCNVRAPSGGSNFRQYFYGIRYLGHPLTSTENFTEIVQGEPLRRGS